MRYLLALMLLLSNTANAAEGLLLKYMVNPTHPSMEKGLAVGRQTEFSVLEVKTEGGFWIDNTKKPGAKSSAFIQGSLGVEPTAGAFYANVFQGIAAISSPDSVLGGPVQFVEEAGVGIRDKDKFVGVGIFYKHISSAGIFKPNLGRDFFGIQVFIPW